MIDAFRGIGQPNCMPQLSCYSPLGALTISEDEGRIVALDWGWGRDQEETPLLVKVRDLLEQYFDGEKVDFSSLPFSPYGTPYRQKVWQAILKIPYGETRTYAQIAAQAGGSARSIGGAMGANPIPVLIPCHRVVGTNGLGGYSGLNGVVDKRILLNLEKGE
ncbi:MAG: methylated-DNA--[protein]-cysteine S-methyltransferase [Gluconobacter sp.]|uniref:methylated-DNA--[protein]-cysteine S-methyltransferase n=1 Tax=Gluconobacter sp. TaxID=1876758 RepID=UPI0039EB3EF0